MKPKAIRPKSVEIEFTVARIITFDFGSEDDNHEERPAKENLLPPPDDFEEMGEWQPL